jgi:hypothetical protein
VFFFVFNMFGETLAGRAWKGWHFL